MIKDRAEVGEGGGDSVVVFNEVLVLTPRCVDQSSSLGPSISEKEEG